MALSQQKFREMVFQILFSEENGRPDSERIAELMMAELAVTKKNVKLAQDKVRAIVQKLPDIDRLIASASVTYDFHRIQSVAKNVIRLGVYELLYDDSVPPKVAIAEAMRLARKFGTKESAAFVNALLDHIYRADEGNRSGDNLLEASAEALKQSEESEPEIAEQAARAKAQKSLQPDENE